MTAHVFATRTSAEEAAFDTVLVQRFKGGDESAFVEIMRRHRDKILSIAVRFIHDRADAEEITQDTFIRAHRGLIEFRGDSSLATWLNRIAINLARNRYWYFFRRRRQDTISLDYKMGEDSEITLKDFIVVGAADPAQESAQSEFANLVASCMERLNPDQREMLMLRAVRDLPYEEIAAALGVRVGTVKSRIARARRNLRKLLGDVCPEFALARTGADYFLQRRTKDDQLYMHASGDR